MAKTPEPADFKASERDVDTEASVTKLAGDGTALPKWKPRKRRASALPGAPAVRGSRVRRSGSWLTRLLRSLFR
jgi:hypothetical protein